MRQCHLVSDVSDVLTNSPVASISMLIFLVVRYVVTVVCMHFMFCLMCASVKHAGGCFLLKPFVMLLFMLCNTVSVQSLLQPCWVVICGMLFVMYGIIF